MMAANGRGTVADVADDSAREQGENANKRVRDGAIVPPETDPFLPTNHLDDPILLHALHLGMLHQADQRPLLPPSAASLETRTPLHVLLANEHRLEMARQTLPNSLTHPIFAALFQSRGGFGSQTDTILHQANLSLAAQGLSLPQMLAPSPAQTVDSALSLLPMQLTNPGSVGGFQIAGSPASGISFPSNGGMMSHAGRGANIATDILGRSLLATGGIYPGLSAQQGVLSTLEQALRSARLPSTLLMAGEERPRKRQVLAPSTAEHKADASPSSTEASNASALLQAIKIMQRGGGTTAAPQKGPDVILLLAVPDDELKLNEQQIYLRNQIEVFRATPEDVVAHTRGRNKPVVVGQVGIRCKHCAHLSASLRRKGSTYFPSALMGLYQASQNMSVEHLQSGVCTEMPPDVKKQFADFSSKKAGPSGAGRPYWAEAGRSLGLVDTESGIRFATDTTCLL